MATIDLTLNGIKIPALDGYTPPFGTKKVAGGLTTQEVNDNIIAPFVKERAIEITEDSSTGNIEYNANLVITTNYAALTLGSGSYQGCKVTVSTTQSYAFIKFNSSCVCITLNAAVTFIWSGSSWAVASGATFVLDNTMWTHIPANTKPSNWKEYLGPGTYYFCYAFDINTSYDLPDPNCNITVTWRHNTSASALAVETYISTGGANRNTRLWTKRHKDSWSTQWTTIYGGGSGNSHNATLQSPWNTGSVTYMVKNGWCQVKIWGVYNSLSDGGQRVIATDIPPAKTGFAQSGKYHTFYIFEGQGQITIEPYTVATIYQTLEYMVADDWIEP